MSPLFMLRGEEAQAQCACPSREGRDVGRVVQDRLDLLDVLVDLVERSAGRGVVVDDEAALVGFRQEAGRPSRTKSRAASGERQRPGATMTLSADQRQDRRMNRADVRE